MSKENVELQPESRPVAKIKLQGEPYQRHVDGVVVDCSLTLEDLAQSVDYQNQVRERIEQAENHLDPLRKGGFYGIDHDLKSGRSLSFEQSFSAMTFVSMGVNNTVYEHLGDELPEGHPNDPDTVFFQSIALLSALSAKEAFVGLTPEEIAGLTAATLEIDTIVRVPSQGPTFGIGGMGGDRGYPLNGERSKLFSASTLAAITLATFGPTHKHHSYPNTSKVAGQSAIESFGGRSDQTSLSAMTRLQEEAGLIMTSCHTTRLIHTLSHRLKGETINHVVGPLSLPVSSESPVHAMIGVNEKVHPETIIEALSILQSKGVQSYENSVSFCGLNTTDPNLDILDPDVYYYRRYLKDQVAIDEVAPPPYPTIASFLIDGIPNGSFIIYPEDFMSEDFLAQVDFDGLFIPNTTDDILTANITAIEGQDLAKTAYVAMTVALGLFTKHYSHLPNAFDQIKRRVNADMLRKCFDQAINSILDGNAKHKLGHYVPLSQETASLP